jgi:membrane protein required for colicin V production
MPSAGKSSNGKLKGSGKIKKALPLDSLPFIWYTYQKLKLEKSMPSAVTQIAYQFNWVDLFVIIVLIRTTYIGLAKGFFGEIFKSLGVLAAVVLSLKYYQELALFFAKSPVLEPAKAEILAFFLLTLFSLLVFKILRLIFTRLVKVEAVEGIERYGGLVLGFLRGLVLSGLIITFLYLLSIKYLKESIETSLSAHTLLNIFAKVAAFLGQKFLPT